MAERGIDYLLGANKRRLDVLGSLALGTGLLPVFWTTAAISAIDTGDFNPIIAQGRVGTNGAMFEALKLRTLKTSKTDKTEIKTYGTFDPRASKIGLFLRQTGMDELPQLANVFRGDMSLVGHRPLLEDDLQRRRDADSKMFEDWYPYYNAVRSGLVGESQFMRHHYLHNTPELLQLSMGLDLEYYLGATLLGDMRILTSSPLAMFKANIKPINNDPNANAPRFPQGLSQ